MEETSGDITIVGEPSAKAHGTAHIEGARQGVDGDYEIFQVTHHYTRMGGFTTTLELMNQNAGSGGSGSAAGGATDGGVDATANDSPLSPTQTPVAPATSSPSIPGSQPVLPSGGF